jgi:hypothetical protein
MGVAFAMNCQDARELFRDLLEAHIGLTEQVPLEAHLSQCASCQQELEALRTSEPPRSSAWRPNLDFAKKALEDIRRADMVDRLRQRVFPRDRISRRARFWPALFGRALDVLRPADTISPQRRSVHARPAAPWWPRLSVDLVRRAREATGRIDIANRLRRTIASIDAEARRVSQRLDVTGKALEVARRALEIARPVAVATWHRRRIFLHVRPRHLRLPATVMLVLLTAFGLFQYRAELDVAVRRWVPSAPSSGEAPPRTPMAFTEPATRPVIPRISAPTATVPAPPALDRLIASPAPENLAPERTAPVTAPAKPMKSLSQPAKPVTERRAPAPSPADRDTRADRLAKPTTSKPGQVEAPLQKSKNVSARQSIVASAPAKDKASDAAAALAPPASRGTRPSLDVVGRLHVKSRKGAEHDLTTLLARAGGATVSRQRGKKVTVIEAVVPNPTYDKFAAGLTRIGSWQIEAGRPLLPDPVRITVRLAE